MIYRIDTIEALHASRIAYAADVDRDKYTPEQWKALGDALHAPTAEADACESVCDILSLAASDCVIVAAGDGKKKPLRVRQKAMRVDAVNKNRRVYPRPVVQAALDEARSRAQNGVMHSYLRHPEVVVVKGEELFVSRPGDETAIIDSILPIGADGWVWIERTILEDLPKGKLVADAIRKKKPYGLSTRFKNHGELKFLDGQFYTVSDWMGLHTWDDVTNPAVDEAGEFQLLTDEQKQIFYSISSHVDIAPGGSNASASTARDADLQTQTAGADGALLHTEKGHSQMLNEQVARAKNRLLALIATRADATQITLARKALSDEIARVAEANLDDAEGITLMAKAAAECDAMLTQAGYHPGGPGLKIQEGGKLGFDDPGHNAGIEDGKKATEKPASRSEDTGMMSADEVAEWRAERERAAKAKADAELTTRVEQCLADSAPFKALPTEHKDYVKRAVKSLAAQDKETPIADILKAELDAIAPLVASQQLAQRGWQPNDANGGGRQENNSRQPARTKGRMPDYMRDVDALIAASDSVRMRTEGFDPNSVARLRQHNLENFILPLMDEWAVRQGRFNSMREQVAAEDAMFRGGEQAFFDAITPAGSQLSAVQDDTLVSSMYNQSVVLMTLLVQSFWEMSMLQHVDVMGPGLADRRSDGMGGWVQTGNSGPNHVPVYLRIPVEYYENPGTYGIYAGPQYDAGLLVPENTGIPTGVVHTAFLPFAAAWRRIGLLATKDVIRAMGSGALNYPVVARHLYHIGADKSRRIDKALADEQIQGADIYNPTTVASETVNLTNNSVYASGGSVSVNLNPTKAANASITATDDSVTYGTNVIGAVRLKCAGNGSSSPYFGSADGAVPLVKPYNEIDLNAAGAVTTTAKFPITISAPGSAIEGYLDENFQVQNFPGGGTATYAVDHENGVIVFKSGVTNGGSGTLITTTVTVSAYSYITNYDNFIVSNMTLATGETNAEYFNRLLNQFDVTAARMGSAPRYARPNLALMSLNAATYITQATIFYKFNSPAGTDYFPTEDIFFERNGVRGAQHNTPWRIGDRRIFMGRRGATKYGIETPFEIEGPYPTYDSSQNVKDAKVMYGSENSVICTPMVKKQDGTILNPPSRTILLRNKVQ